MPERKWGKGDDKQQRGGIGGKSTSHCQHSDQETDNYLSDQVVNYEPGIVFYSCHVMAVKTCFLYYGKSEHLTELY